ncbi:MAG: COR domain-containing protein [Luteolibacter sp.]
MNRQKGHPFDTDRERLALKYNVDVEHFFRTDCADAKSIVPLQKAILSEVASMLAKEERFAASAWDVKTQLGSMKEAGLDYLSEQSYQDLCEKHGVTAEQEQQALLRRLACIGTVVSFPDDLRMSALSVLNPEWATDGIYRVMTCEDLRERKLGVLSMKKLRELLPKNRWPKPLHVQYVVDLMVKFDLCFPVDGNADTMLVPELLPDKTPPLGDWKPAKCVVFHYEYTVLPHGVLPRFITRTHLLSDGQERWRTGVILADDGAESRLQADYDANTLSIWVRGDHATARRGLLKVIRNHFEAIHSRIEGLDAKEMVAVPGHPEVLVPYRDVILDERAGEPVFRVSVDGIRIAWPIAELLNGVESSKERKQATLNDKYFGMGTKMDVHGNYYAGDHIEKNTAMNDDHSIKIGGNVTNAQVGQTLTLCTNMIQLQPSGERKELLEQLDREARELITALPEDQQKKASKNLELAVKSVTEGEPDRDWYDVSAKGLLEASKFVKDFSGNIAETIKNLGSSVWPEFKLPNA